MNVPQYTSVPSLLDRSTPLLEMVPREALTICVVFYYQEKQYILFANALKD